MVFYVLKIKGDLEGIDKLIPKPGNYWKFNIAGPDGVDSGDIKKGITLCADEVVDIAGSRGEANFICRFPGSDQQAHASLVPIPDKASKKKSPKFLEAVYKKSDSGEFVPILCIECRGLEPVGWIPSIDFDVCCSDPNATEEDELNSKINEALEVNFSTASSDGEYDAVNDNTTSRNINRSAVDWCDYDEQFDTSVSITNFEWKIEKL